MAAGITDRHCNIDHTVALLDRKSVSFKKSGRIPEKSPKSYVIKLTHYPMFTYATTIKLHETDAAGLLFFSNQFKIIHDAYESLLETWGFGFATLIRKKDYFLPIVHAESDYKAPLFVGDKITINVTIAHVGTTSFTFAYTLLNSEKKIVGTAKTVHVTMDKKSSTKIPLPPDMRAAIKKFSG